MNRPYGKPKDRYIAAAQTVGLLAAVPFVAAYLIAAGCVRAAGDVLDDVRRCFEGGVVRTAREVHSEMMDHASGKRARRERQRNQTK